MRFSRQSLHQVFPFFVDGIDLLRLWSQLDAAEQDACLYHLAPVIGHMHAQGVYHGDTNWRNILVRPKKVFCRQNTTGQTYL